MARRVRASMYQDLDYVLLSLIRMHPNISGYQLRHVINKSTGYFFHAHLSQIYPSLRRLSDAKLVTYTQVVRDGKPDLKLYAITTMGERELHAWLVRPYEFETSRVSSDRYFMKLILMGHLAPEEVSAYIDDGIAAFTEQEKRIRENNLQMENDFIAGLDEEVRDRYWTLWGSELDFMLHEMRTRIDWLKALKLKLGGFES